MRRTLNSLESELKFLLLSAKKFIEVMEKTLTNSEYETFLRAFRQFHRVIGEIFATIKHGGNPGISAASSLYISVMSEAESLLRKASELEEKYISVILRK